MSMTILLPNEKTSFEDFQSLLTKENWESWKMEMKRKEGTILLPKFQLEFETSLKESLQQLGMHTAFDPKLANFSKLIMEDKSLFISEIKQKTFLDVQETGTEAAAVTAVEVEKVSAPVDPPFYMEVNRPFFLTINHHQTDAIVFMSCIQNP